MFDHSINAINSLENYAYLLGMDYKTDLTWKRHINHQNKYNFRPINLHFDSANNTQKTIQSNQLQIITRKVPNNQTIEQRTEQLK